MSPAPFATAGVSDHVWRIEDIVATGLVTARYSRGVSKQALALPFVVAGLVGIGVGVWAAAGLIHDIVYEAEGKCDYLPCTNAQTLPSLVAALVVVALGAAVVAWAVFLDRRHLNDAKPESN